MTPYYLYVLLGSILVPLLFTILRLDFIKYWRIFFISTTIIAIVFLIWDALFVNAGVWGFAKQYCVGIYLFEMPLEELLFFFVIPFCSIFTHYALFYAYPNLHLERKITLFVSILLILTAVLVIIIKFDKVYTLVNTILFLLVLVLALFYNINLLQRFFISFLIILIPFFIVNGVLTGAITETPIVWYDNEENLGIRLVTIPIEDIFYAFTMLLGNLLIFESLNRRKEVLS